MGQMECMVCKSIRISSRTNYPSGKHSKSRTTKKCKNCGNTTDFRHPDGTIKKWRASIIASKTERARRR